METKDIISIIILVILSGIGLYSYTPGFEQTLEDLNKKSWRELLRIRHQNKAKDEEEREERANLKAEKQKNKEESAKKKAEKKIKAKEERSKRIPFL